MLDPKRLVEVKGAKTGSGYLIAKGLILTAGHLAGTGTKVQVTLLAERLASGNPTPRPARVLWQSDDLNLDFALLQIDETDELYAVRWAELPSSADLQAEAFGFPDAEFFYAPGAPTTRTYDTRKIAGKVFGGANLIAITQGTGSAIVQVSSLAPSLAGDFGRRGL